MAVQIKSFNVNLATTTDATYTYTTNFAADVQLGQVTLSALSSSVDLSDGNTALDTPVVKGLQENVEIWLDSSAGANYDALLWSGSFNGRSSILWIPAATFFLNSGSELRIIIHNRARFGSVYGTAIANTI